MNSEKEVNGNQSDNTNNGSQDGKKKEIFPKRNYKKITTKTTTIKKEGLDKVIERRNSFLVKFFRLIDLPVRIIGDENNPALIYNEEAVLNAYVHNFELRFTDSPISKNVVYTVKLDENPRFDKNRVLQCLSEYKARAIFKVALKTTPKLYLTGYNFLNKEEKLGRYPVFSSYNPKIYFIEDKAKDIADELNNDGYQAVCE